MTQSRSIKRVEAAAQRLDWSRYNAAHQLRAVPAKRVSVHVVSGLRHGFDYPTILNPTEAK